MTFRPKRAMTRAELIDLEANVAYQFYRLIKSSHAVLKEENSSCIYNKELTLNQFTLPQDVNSDDWYYDSYKTIAWITDNDYLAPRGLFRGEEPINRGEMAVFLNKFLNGLERILASSFQPTNSTSQILYKLNNNQELDLLKSNALAKVTSIYQLRDVNPNDYFYEDLRNLVEKYGILADFPAQTFRANQAASRGEIVALVNASLNQVERFLAATEAICREKTSPRPR